MLRKFTFDKVINFKFIHLKLFEYLNFLKLSAYYFYYTSTFPANKTTLYHQNFNPVLVSHSNIPITKTKKNTYLKLPTIN